MPVEIKLNRNVLLLLYPVPGLDPDRGQNRRWWLPSRGCFELPVCFADMPYREDKDIVNGRVYDRLGRRSGGCRLVQRFSSRMLGGS